MRTLGLIGFGRFGQFAAKHLRSNLHLFVWDMRDQRKKAASMGVTWGTLEEAAACQSVLLAVPISELPDVLARIGSHLRPGATVLDVCSVKLAPLEWMMAATPENVEVIGTHPLFGPASARGGLEGHTIALCPGRTRKLDALVRFLENLGLQVVVTSAEEHDRQMAQAQAVTHYLARALAETGVGEQELTTPSFDLLLKLTRDLAHDTPELFRDMQLYNPFAQQARSRILSALMKIDAQIEKES